MGINIGKISPIKGNFAPNTVKAALSSIGLTRFWGTGLIQPPHKERDGSYRTGLDENAEYIRQMPASEQKQEKAKVKGFLAMAQKHFGNIDLGPRAPFWTKASEKYGQPDVVNFANLKDGDNVFDFNDPQALIQYCYLRVHPNIAPSGQAVLDGVPETVKYYVNDFDVEMEVQYQVQSEILEALGKLGTLSLPKRRMIAKQCGIAVTDETSDQAIMVHLKNYIDASVNHKKSTNVKFFIEMVDLKDEHLQVRDTLDTAIKQGVIKYYKSAYWRGQERLAGTKEDLLNYLTDHQNQDIYLGILAEIKLKRAQRI